MYSVVYVVSIYYTPDLGLLWLVVLGCCCSVLDVVYR